MFQGLNLRRSFSDDSVMSGLNTSMDSCTESVRTLLVLFANGLLLFYVELIVGKVLATRTY